MIETNLKWLGRPFNNAIRPTFLFVLLILIITYGQTAIRQFTPWNDAGKQLLAIENLIDMYFILFTFMELAVYPKNHFTMIELLKQPIFKNSFPYSERQKEILNVQNKKDNKIYKSFIIICSFYPIFKGLFPYLLGLYKINYAKHEIESNEDIPTPYDCWLPFLIDDNYKYIMAATPQLLCRVYSLLVGVHWSIIVLSVIKYVSTELKILTCYVKDIDKRLGPNADEAAYKKYMSNIVQHHVGIIRYVSDINQHAKFMMLSFNQMIIFELCFACYTIIEVKNIMIRIRSLGVLLIVVIVNASFSSFGQQLIDEFDKFRIKLEHSSWLGKPLVYQKMVLIILINSQKPLHIKPAGLYILNAEHTKSTLNAVYSYLSLMRKVKSV